MKQFMISVLTIFPAYLGAMSKSVNEKVCVESSQDEAEQSVKRARSEEEQYEPVPVKRALESESSSHRVKRVAWDFSELENLSAEEKDERLLLAAELGETHLVEALLSCGADKDALTGAGEHSFHLAAKNGHVKVIEKLYELGADLSAQAFFGFIALHYAAQNGHVEVIEKLHELGSTIDARDNYDRAPLHLAASKGHVGVIEKLHELGVTIDAHDTMGFTAMHVAARKGEIMAIAKLSELGATIDAQDRFGSTPLHVAAKNGHAEVIEKLYELGAHLDMPTKTGNTPLHVAAHDGQVSAIAKLHELGATLDKKNKKGFTPLHGAAWWGHVEVIAKLRDLEVAVDIEDKDGNTPLQVAALNGRFAAVNELLSPLPFGTDSITLAFVGGEKREVQKNVVLISTTLDSVCKSSQDRTIPLTTITAATWDAIMKFEKELYALEFIYNSLLGGTNEGLGGEYDNVKQSIVRAYQMLSYEEIHKIIDAANFLDIKVLVRLAAAALIEKAMKKCSQETKKIVAGEFNKYCKKNFPEVI